MAHDLEIYARERDLDRIVVWLEGLFGRTRQTERAGDSVIYKAGKVSVVITPDIENGAFAGVSLRSPQLPWSSDLECARDAHRALGVEIRCDPGDAAPSAAPTQFWFISGSEEGLIDWVPSSNNALQTGPEGSVLS